MEYVPIGSVKGGAFRGKALFQGDASRGKASRACEVDDQMDLIRTDEQKHRTYCS